MTATSGTLPAAITLDGVSVTFGGAKAIDDISLEIPAGRVTALLGMNGSGKSTLIKVLAGIYTPDAGGRIRIAGDDIRVPMSPQAARSHGLRFVHQDVGLVDALSVADNFGLVAGFPTGGAGVVRTKRLQDRVRDALTRVGLHIDPETGVGDLAPSTKTMVAVARALYDPDLDLVHKVLVLDEPTASLPQESVDEVLRLVETLKAAGQTILYVSHRIDEVRRIADEMVVLRDGRLISQSPVGGRRQDEIITEIVGFDLAPDIGGGHHEPEPRIALSLRNISGTRVRELDLDVRAGEILGIAGLTGCGRSELLRILSGVQYPTAGRMELGGAAYAPRSPRAALRAGVAAVPENRRRDGVVMDMNVAENLTLGRLQRFTSRLGLLRRRAERDSALGLIREHDVRPPFPDVTIATLSGGNQQKVVVARAEQSASVLLLLDEPTQGVDAKIKREVAGRIREKAVAGVAVVIGSSDSQELAELCHRVIILDRGRPVMILNRDEVSEERILAACAREVA